MMQLDPEIDFYNILQCQNWFFCEVPMLPFSSLFQEPAKNSLALSIGHKHSAHATLDLILGWLVRRGNTSGVTAKFSYVISSCH